MVRLLAGLLAHASFALATLQVGGVDVGQFDLLDLVRLDGLWATLAQQCLELCNVRAPDGLLGEVQGKGDKEVATNEGVLVHGHALVLDAERLACLDEGVGAVVLDQQLTTVQVLDGKGGGSESLDNGDPQVHVQIVPVASEGRVRLLLQRYNDVTRFHVGVLVGLAAEVNLLPGLHALVNVHLDDFARLGNLATAAGAAAVGSCERLARPVAGRTHAGHPLHKARLDLHVANDLTTATARSAFHWRLARLGTGAVAPAAQHVTLHRQLGLLALVQ
mmetsp:Transcript_15088/g.47146  ORF Transcript_15088/g.47146 Transcript_15088/m.47146 type:complete len:276 (+) Transcript_15088:108-935(+)